MVALRKTLSVLLILILIPLISAQIVLQTARSLVTDTGVVKAIARQTGLYTDLQSVLAGSVQPSGNAAVNELTPEEMSALISNVLPPAQVETMVESVIDGLQHWIVGGGARPVIVWDMTGVKQRYPGAVQAALTAKLAKLPPCTMNQLFGMAQNPPKTLPTCNPGEKLIQQYSNLLPIGNLATLPAQVDVVAEFERGGHVNWAEIDSGLAEFRFLLGLVPLGWAAILLLVALLALLNLDHWYTAPTWAGAGLFLGGGLTLLGIWGLSTLMRALLASAFADPTAQVLLEGSATLLVQWIVASLRNLSLVITVAGLAGLVVGVAGALRSRPAGPDRTRIPA